MASSPIGVTVVVSGTPTDLGPFTPALGAARHALTFDVGAWAGTILTIEFLVAFDGITFLSFAKFTYAGPVSAWVNKLAGAVTSIGPSVSLPADSYPAAVAATRVKWRITADGAFASTGGSYVSA